MLQKPTVGIRYRNTLVAATDRAANVEKCAVSIFY